MGYQDATSGRTSPSVADKKKKRTRIKVSLKNINQKENTGTYRDIHEFYKKIMIMKPGGNAIKGSAREKRVR